ncbi:MAG: prepilin-type N-terminal cleavage/methylation domain-containing protein [Verrucomicrobiia bacterium]|jgi:prepilin-type N-terminal cleavage/methylation domain-containing protein/prepilin-type processing-associated H-X9-DG protein
MKTNSHSSQAGFSVTELLVVVAVIGVLLAMLLPSVNRTKNSARKAHCSSNLKQWAIIWNVYTSDNDGKFSEGRSSKMPRGEWVWALSEQYLEQPGLLHCPDALDRRGYAACTSNVERKMRADTPENLLASYGGPFTAFNFPANPAIEPLPGKFWSASYGINNWAYNVRGDLQGRKAEYHWREMDIPWETSEVPLFADAMWRGGGPDQDIPEKFAAPEWNGEWSGVRYESKHFAIKRHGHGINVLYFDGSVRQTTKPIDVWKMKWHLKFDSDAWQTNQFPEWML